MTGMQYWIAKVHTSFYDKQPIYSVYFVIVLSIQFDLQQNRTILVVYLNLKHLWIFTTTNIYFLTFISSRCKARSCLHVASSACVLTHVQGCFIDLGICVGKRTSIEYGTVDEERHQHKYEDRLMCHVYCC